jgi:hypothetical protein
MMMAALQKFITGPRDRPLGYFKDFWSPGPSADSLSIIRRLRSIFAIHNPCL